MRRAISRIICIIVVVVALLGLHPSIGAASSVFVNIPGITGESPVPGYPNALAAQSISISSSGFSVVRQVDVASPKIVDAVTLGTLFPSTSSLFYDTTPSGAPDATLPFQGVVASGYQLLGVMNSLERDVFNSTTHYSMFLELPGITGEGPSPGPAGSMALQSFTLDGQHFSVVRPVDSATPPLEEAVANGTAFSTASVFFFDPSNSSSPTATLIFQDVLASSIMIDTTNLPEETDGFAFESLAAEQGPAQSVPEPSSALLLSAGAVSLACFVRRRSLRQTIECVFNHISL
jgi:type VI protein secretion system component Hcp